MATAAETALNDQQSIKKGSSGVINWYGVDAMVDSDIGLGWLVIQATWNEVTD